MGQEPSGAFLPYHSGFFPAQRLAAHTNPPSKWQP
jgi:hypothetical protein